MARPRFIAHTAGVFTATAVLLAAVFTSPASACICNPGNEALRYQQATYVFSGEVVAEKVEESVYRYTVVVDTEYKGDVPRRVHVLTQRNNSCGLTLEVGTEYLVFAKGDVADRRVETDQCSGIRLAAGGPPVTTSPAGTTTTIPTTTPCATATP
ncbi:hypothetical protein AB0K14_22080 [Actinosynnema sp. NPDC050801]|uniref:hypothetical protein n=1 Tax=unclassified Actinosynnema TaxID=2637065 RepID=UPI00340F396E